jgi:hypothetical protein
VLYHGNNTILHSSSFFLFLVYNSTASLLPELVLHFDKMIASLALPLLLSLAPFADAGLIAYKDSKCTQRQKIISKGKDIAELSTDISITAQGAGRYYKDMQFPSADTLGPTKGQGSNIVYWKVPKPDNGCTIALMHDRKRTSMAATKLPGDVFLLARDEGCFFSSLNVSEHSLGPNCSVR